MKRSLDSTKADARSERLSSGMVRWSPAGATVGFRTAIRLHMEKWMRFAALDVGPTKSHRGKPLSQDAVLWIRAFDFQ